MSHVVCEDHLTLDLARLDLRPGATRRLPRQRASDLEWVPWPFGGYVHDYVGRWTSAAYSRVGDAIRVSVSESSDARTVERSTHVLALIEAPNVVGGMRLWFACPGCIQKARVLYYKPAVGAFRCRTCGGLKHQSTVTFKTQRMQGRLAEISREMGGPGGIYAPLPEERPRYMRKAREAALRAEHARLRADLGIGAKPAPIPLRKVIRVAKSLGWPPPV